MQERIIEEGTNHAITHMNKLYYFTGTGNSLWVAKQLAKSLSGFSLESVSTSLAKNENIENPESASIGLIFPVYIFGPPLIVKRFLKKLQVSKNQYVFCIAVHGGYPANTIHYVRNLFRKEGGHLNSGFCIKMPDNYIMNTDPPSNEIVKEIMTSAMNRISAIAEMAKNNTNGVFEKGNPITNWIFTGVLYRLFIGKLSGYSKKYVVEDSCNACGTCVSVCPMNNIELKGNKPIWGTSCEMCLSCIQNCPVQAIQWGNKTKMRTRYRNPEISIQELKNQNPNIPKE